jgi:hypothetical protein
VKLWIAGGILFALLITSSSAQGCDCLAPTGRQAKKHSELIFRGRITGFRDTGEGYRNVVFAVGRVWKGDVPSVFEMPALPEGAACTGFWPSFLEVGKCLLVYAYRLAGSSPDYLADICSRTSPAENSKIFQNWAAIIHPKSDDNSNAGRLCGWRTTGAARSAKIRRCRC